MTAPEISRLQEPMEEADNGKAGNSSVWQEDLAGCKISCQSINSGAVLQNVVRNRVSSIMVFRTLQKNSLRLLV